MSDRYFYGADGRYLGHSSDTGPDNSGAGCGCLLIILAAIFLPSCLNDCGKKGNTTDRSEERRSASSSRKRIEIGPHEEPQDRAHHRQDDRSEWPSGAGARVPAWATLLEAAPDPQVVTSSSLRSAIAATGYAWRVRDDATQIELVLIPPGTFQMGCSSGEICRCGDDEHPNHYVTLTRPFYIGRYELTQAQWQSRMGSNPAHHQSASAQVPASQVRNRPVESVTWSMVQAFLNGSGMRLPTEAEWEWACRAGTTTAFHSMPDYPDGTNNESSWVVGTIAWFGGNSGGQTRPVGGKAGNGFGLHDMSGNVYEFVNDIVGDYSGSPQADPAGPSYGTERVIRGGSWAYMTCFVRSSERIGVAPDDASNLLGFRVARDP